MSFDLISSKVVYRGPAFNVRQDHLRLPDGNQVQRDIVDHVGSVVILPVDEDGNLLFVRQYRHPVGMDLLELPAGTLEPGEAAEDCARREVREETGMAAGSMQSLGGFYLAPGYSTEYMDVFLATELHAAPLQADEDEFLSVEKIPFHQVLSSSDAGIPASLLPDAKTLAALLLTRPHLEKLAK